MKTKIASLCLAAVFSILAFATNSSAADDGFYDKEHIRGFVSLGGDFRGMLPGFHDYINDVALAYGSLRYRSDTDSTIYQPAKAPKYSKFNKFYPGLQFNVGAQYKQFMTWINFNFMLTQISERPNSTITAYALDSTGTRDQSRTASFPLYDARWFSYGADWMFGWKILGEDAFFNLIPAVGIGFNMMNIHFTSNYLLTSLDSKEDVIMRDRYYSTMSASFNAELEARLQFEQFSIGIYGGYRAVRYNDIKVEGTNLYTTSFDTDNDGDTWFVGLRIGWTFLSPWEKKQLDKI